jgi:hypothetical protein
LPPDSLNKNIFIEKGLACIYARRPLARVRVTGRLALIADYRRLFPGNLAFNRNIVLFL